MGGPSDLELPCRYLLTETDGLLLCGESQYDSNIISEKDRSYAYQRKTVLELVVLVTYRVWKSQGEIRNRNL